MQQNIPKIFGHMKNIKHGDRKTKFICQIFQHNNKLQSTNVRKTCWLFIVSLVPKCLDDVLPY